MGYFSNGIEGDMYEEEYCHHCIHYHEEYSCPVLEAHAIWNYDECNKPDSILHKIIPKIIVKGVDKNGVPYEVPTNGECIFYVKRKGKEK